MQVLLEMPQELGSMYALIAAGAAVLFGGIILYNKTALKAAKEKQKNATPEERKRMKAEQLDFYNGFFVLDNDEHLLFANTTQVYTGNQISKDRLPEFIEDMDYGHDGKSYIGLTSKKRFLVVIYENTLLEDKLVTHEIPLEAKITKGENLFPNGKNTQNVGLSFLGGQQLDLYLIQSPKIGSFGIWLHEQSAQEFLNVQELIKNK